MLMYLVKAFVTGGWFVVGYFPTLDDANLYQDGLWLNDASVITEVEFRGFN